MPQQTETIRDVDPPYGDGEVPQTIARRLHVGRWIFGGVVLFVVILGFISLWRNPAIDHSVVARYLTAEAILEGLRSTIVLAVISMLLGTALSIPIALMRMSSNPILQTMAWTYVWLFRGVPLLVQILVWGNLALFSPNIALGIPFTSITFFSWDTNLLVTSFVASILALSLNEASYMAEIVRAGLMSVQHGQEEAARALGLSRSQSIFKIVLPQATRIMIPPTGTQFINMLKMTSLVSVIAGGDLLTKAQNISAVNLATMELLVVASLWYLLITSIASVGQAFLERRLAKAHRR